MQSTEHRAPRRKDTFDLRDNEMQARNDRDAGGLASDEEHSVLEDDSSIEGDDQIDYISDDDSSSLSIPNESIDFDLVYSLTNFAATVEGQASVVKGDSLFLMDDSNSYWWLVRVLKTQEVGYIPAENIETPFERLARLNRHRNVDLASATQAEKDEGEAREQKVDAAIRRGMPTPIPPIYNKSRPRVAKNAGPRGVEFMPTSVVCRYPPAVWNEEDEEEAGEEWDEDDVDYEDAPVKDEDGYVTEEGGDAVREEEDVVAVSRAGVEEPMDWQGTNENRARTVQPQEQQQSNVPAALRAGMGRQSPYGQLDQKAPEIDMNEQEHGQQLRQQTSRERLLGQQRQDQPTIDIGPETRMVVPSNAPARTTSPMLLDPAQATDTRKLTVTPVVARDGYVSPEPESQRQKQQGPLLPSAIMQQQQQVQEQERKRQRDEIEAAEEEARKRAIRNQGSPARDIREKELVRTSSQETRSSSSSGTNGNKLRKDSRDRDRDRESEDENGKEKKKRGVFGGLFSRKKDKDKDKGRDKSSVENIAAAASADGSRMRESEDSAMSSAQSHYTSTPPENVRGGQSPAPGSLRAQPLQSNSRGPSPQTALQQPIQQQSQMQSPSPQPGQQPQPQVSQHTSSLRERDQQQQALYQQQYLKRSPASPPEPSYGLMSASTMPSSSSNTISSSGSSGGGLSVGMYGDAPLSPGMRTPSGRPGSLILSPMVGQAALSGDGPGVPELSVIRMFAGKNLQSDATFKTVLLNSSTTAADLVKQAMQRFRLPAGENKDDFYLTIKQVEGSTAVLQPNEKPLVVFEQLVEEALEMPKVKRSSMGSISSVASNLSAHPAIRKLAMNDFTDDSAVKFYLNRRGDDDSTAGDDDTVMGDTSITTDGDTSFSSIRNHYLLPSSSSSTSNVTPERFSSPSARFALQVVIFPEELPDDMVFDPHTEAIVFKNTLRDRSQMSALASPGISQSQRRKIFVFPKNITVAEVIELALERFGILEGVVDGGDEVEDKLTKRMSSSRVRYMLMIQAEGQDRELQPSSKIIDAYPRPPTFRRSGEIKRRSIDSMSLLGTLDDVQPDDPIFVLRRAVTYRPSANSKHRLSTALDEVALSRLHRDSSASESSVSAAEEKPRQMSRQEIIAAQRAATLATQKAMLSTQANSHRGVDVVLPGGKAMLRSQRHEIDDRMRYSYVHSDGETYDVSDIFEEEFKEQQRGGGSPQGVASGDLLKGAVTGSQPGVDARLIDRVLNKINGKGAQGALSAPASGATAAIISEAIRSTSPSLYSDDGGENVVRAGSRSVTPTAGRRAVSPSGGSIRNQEPTRSRSVTPTAGTQSTSHHHPQPSIESVMSDMSAYRSPTPLTPPSGGSSSQGGTFGKKLRIPKGEFGLTEMLAVIETRAMEKIPPPPPPLDEIDQMLFGPKIDLDSIHPQIRDIYAPTLKKMAELDSELDKLLDKAIRLI